MSSGNSLTGIRATAYGTEGGPANTSAINITSDGAIGTADARAYRGIEANHYDSGDVNIAINDDIFVSERAVDSRTRSGSVSVTGSGNISSDRGIYLESDGTGTVSVDYTGDITSRAYAVDAEGYSGANVSVRTTGSLTVLDGGGAVIYAGSELGAVSLDIGGSVNYASIEADGNFNYVTWRVR